jgi:hypothetical protein
MPTHAEEQVALVDELIDRRRAPVTKMGTVVSVSPGVAAGTDPGEFAAQVVFDSSSGQPQDVKCPASVLCAPEDRVGLVKYEGEWLITVNYTLRTLGDASFDQYTANFGTTTSTTFVDVPTAAHAVLPLKYRDATFLRITIATAMFTSALPTTVEVAARVSTDDGSVDYDETVIRRGINEANSHAVMVGWVTTGALPGGIGYDVAVRWRRAAGTATLTMNGDDGVFVRVQEVTV